MWDCFKCHFAILGHNVLERTVTYSSLKYLTGTFLIMYSRSRDGSPGTVPLEACSQLTRGIEFSPALRLTLLVVSMGFLLHLLLQIVLKDIRTF